ncbi:uncharacterized protein RHO25_000207 [Cercospora beticola]|uniref:Heterokaryon incompatibility domain-containing protein n=1 Tax=Cercospora beticola TaxID=122368 RepID=A0ABZ0N7W3_CERBT|nr:hypothetical protein RHO25_000207 [Cercospora beticola]
MRLLNINTLEFKVFPTEQDRPPYVITSHRWSNDEITFQQFLAHKSDPSICQMRGFQKIQSFCKFVKDWATGVGVDWIWIDTCCIDKTSSSELQEAINSMFRWYPDALVCLAYLKDVRSLDTSPAEVMNDEPGNRKITERLEKARAALGQQLGGRSNVEDQGSRRDALDTGNDRVPTTPVKASRLRRSRYVGRSPSPARAARRSASVGPIRDSQKPATKPDIRPGRENATGAGKVHRDDLHIGGTHSASVQKDGPRSSQFEFSRGTAERPLPRFAGFGGSNDPQGILAEFMRGSVSDDEDLFAHFSRGSEARKDDSAFCSPPPLPEPKIVERPLPL